MPATTVPMSDGGVTGSAGVILAWDGGRVPGSTLGYHGETPAGAGPKRDRLRLPLG
jgi:hypothetical protein